MSTATAPPAVLTVRDLARAFGRRRVLRGVSFTLAAGTLVGIVGENGAGKSTLLKLLAGELRPDAGAIHCRGRLGYCPQLPVLNEALTVRQHLAYFAAAYGITDLSCAEHLLDALSYRLYLDARVAVLSGGTRQKLNLTLALMHRPDVLLLDEPYQGFDWETYLRFWELAADLRREGRAVLVISHLLFERERFDQLFHMRQGQLEQER